MKRKSPGRRQPHRLPPPLLWPGERMLSEALLREHEGVRGLVLWKTARTMASVAALEHEELTELRNEEVYDSRAALVRAAFSELAWREPLLRLAGVYATDGGDPDSWCSDCLEVAQLAEFASAPMTALEFTQAAAMLKQNDVRAARLAGIRARAIGRLSAAEVWFAHAINRGRRSEQRGEMVWSYIGLAVVQRLRGANPAARRTLLRGLRKARRHSLSELYGPLHHELLVLAIRMGRPKAILTHARAALEGYGPFNDRVVALAHDIAAGWMDNGFFREALEIFLQTPASYGTPTDQLARAASIVRAAGAIGERAYYESSLAEAITLLRRSGTAQLHSTALLAMARGALSMRDLTSAESYASEALRIARRRGEPQNEFDAEGVLDTIRAAPATLVSPAERSRTNRRVTELTTDVTQVLAGV